MYASRLSLLLGHTWHPPAEQQPYTNYLQPKHSTPVVKWPLLLYTALHQSSFEEFANFSSHKLRFDFIKDYIIIIQISPSHTTKHTSSLEKSIMEKMFLAV